MVMNFGENLGGSSCTMLFYKLVEMKGLLQCMSYCRIFSLAESLTLKTLKGKTFMASQSTLKSTILMVAHIKLCLRLHLGWLLGRILQSVYHSEINLFLTQTTCPTCKFNPITDSVSSGFQLL